MSYLGNYKSGDTVDFTFSTKGTDGAPITLAGSPLVRVYKGNGTTEESAGVTLTVDFDSRTGLHHVRIVTTDAFYAANEDYSVVLTAGTVGGVSVAGTVLRTFSIEKRHEPAVYLRGTTQTNASPTTYDVKLAAGALTGKNVVGCTIDIGGRFRRIVSADSATHEIQPDSLTGLSPTDTTYAYTIYPLIGARIDGDSQSRIEQEILEQVPEALDTDANGRVRIVSGTGAGELDFTAGVVKANTVQVLGTAVDASPTPLDVNVTQINGAGVTASGSGNITFTRGSTVSTLTAANVWAESSRTITGGTITTNSDKTGYSLTAGTGLGNQTANITGTITTVTNLTNLPSIPANWLTAAGIADNAITAAKIGGNAITSEKLAPNAIGAVQIADNAIGASEIADNAITAAKLATDAGNEIADALLDRANGIETSYSLRHAMRVMLAVAAGKSSNSGGTYRDINDTKPRVTATLSDGNRTAVTVDAA
jgi:hypothetical protein